MRECVLCKKPVEAGKKAIELAGGFFDPADEEFFVMDDGVLAVSYLHYGCLEKGLAAAQAAA
jgi:hypothetical protein